MNYESTHKTEILPGSDGEHAMQREFNTERKAASFYNKQVLNELSPLMRDFIAEQEMVFVSTADSKGACDCTFRAGDAGFITSINNKNLIYPEYKGNGVMASLGNISENNNISFLFIDFFDSKIGLHVNGKATIVSNDNINAYLGEHGYTQEEYGKQSNIACYVAVEVEEAYIHCSKNIPLLKKANSASRPNANKSRFSGGDAFKAKQYNRPWIDAVNAEN
ncbi:MAG: pyridoxamine 5-phosphate oxidase [Gammaproteobacteria bacterium]|nr:MAG: pyridoxamine 5-phosphate oxidase [Gammaproteobacteria bacterium]